MSTQPLVPSVPGLYFYSFKDLLVVFSHPLLGELTLVGEVGFNNIGFTYDTERSSQRTAADGSVQISYKAGNSGKCNIQTQQNSPVDQYLIAWANSCYVNGNLQSIANFATATILARSLLNGMQHAASGISPLKMPDRSYAADGQDVTWNLNCGDIETT